MIVLLGGYFFKKGPFFLLFLNFSKFLCELFFSETTLRDLSKNDKIGPWGKTRGQAIFEGDLPFRPNFSLFYKEGPIGSSKVFLFGTHSFVFGNTAARSPQKRRNQLLSRIIKKGTLRGNFGRLVNFLVIFNQFWLLHVAHFFCFRATKCSPKYYFATLSTLRNCGILGDCEIRAKTMLFEGFLQCWGHFMPFWVVLPHTILQQFFTF